MTTEALRAVGLPVALSLLAGCVYWIRCNRPAWRLVVPIMLWALNYLLFVVLLYCVDPAAFRINFNSWGMAIMVHAAGTFGLYLLVMRVSRRIL